MLYMLDRSWSKWGYKNVVIKTLFSTSSPQSRRHIALRWPEPCFSSPAPVAPGEPAMRQDASCCPRLGVRGREHVAC